MGYREVIQQGLSKVISTTMVEESQFHEIHIATENLTEHILKMFEQLEFIDKVSEKGTQIE